MKERQKKMENIFFLLVPQKFLKFSNLRNFMSVRCKIVVISPKNFMFYRNTVNNMQNINKNSKLKKKLWKFFNCMHYSVPNWNFSYSVNFVPDLNLIGCTLMVRGTQLWSHMTLWPYGYVCSHGKLKAWSSLTRPKVTKLGKLVTYGEVKAPKKSNVTQTISSREVMWQT